MIYGNPSIWLLKVAICIVTMSSAMAAGSESEATSKTIPIVECEINGFGLADSPDQMRKAFGEPLRHSAVQSLLHDSPYREYEYKGLQLMFSPSGRSVVSFTVTGAEYRLKSGIGVGSAWTEVIEAFGIGSFASSNGEIIYTYRVVDSNGDLVPAFLNLVVENEVVVRFGVVTSW